MSILAQLDSELCRIFIDLNVDFLVIVVVQALLLVRAAENLWE